jgi:hypothetical protein
MTRRLALPALALGLVAAGAAPASAAPQLIEGSVAPPPGAFASSAVTGTATVFLDDSAYRKRGTFKTVGVAAVRKGEFDITTRPTRLVRRAAERNHGSVNLLLLVKTEAGKSVLPFTRRLVKGRWVARSSISPKLPLHPWGRGTGSTKALASQERSDCEWVRSKNYRRYTRVGQLHQWGGFRSTFYYGSGSQADPEIGAAVAYGRGGFELRSETSVTRTTVGEKGSIIRPPEAGAFSRYVWTRFAFYYLYPRGDDCNRGPRDLTRVLRTSHHVGGSYYKDHDDAARVLDGNCHKADSDQKLIVAPKSTEWASSGTGVMIRRAISIFGVSLTSQSGWSTHVKSEWENVGTVPRAICSVTASRTPPRSHTSAASSAENG